ncbi:MAG TPA: DNRLRE domain-containing protein [Polyangiaceae bacterium]|nr:DNRLRE domain-containing protein [Polyangiaceae bacterium]
MGSFKQNVWVWLAMGSVLSAIGCGANSEPVDSTMLGIGGVGGTGSSGGGATGVTTATFSQGASYTGATDASIVKAAPTTKYGAATTCIVDAGPTSETACALRWSVAAIPTSATILGAEVTLTVSSPSVAQFNVYKLKQRWTQANVTWNNYDSTHPWGTPGAKASTDRDPTPVGSLSGTLGSHTFSIPAAVVQAWLPDSNANDGLLIANDVDADGVIFRSSESANVAEHPTLTVYYQ